MEQWILVLQLATSFQTMGPWPDKASCQFLQHQVEQQGFKVKTGCLVLPQPPHPMEKK